MKQKAKTVTMGINYDLIAWGCGTEQVSETYAERGSVTRNS